MVDDTSHPDTDNSLASPNHGRTVFRSRIRLPDGVEMREKLNALRKSLKRFNQRVLTLPVWLVVGAAGVFRKTDSEGWKNSEKNENYGKMF